MIESLDQQLFLYLNSQYTPFWDQVMFAVSGRLLWVPLYLAIMISLVLKFRRRFLVILLFIILGITLSDQISVLFKNVFQRLRPCHEPALEGLVHLLKGRCGGLYGFVSSHATNSFYVALISLLFIRKRWFTIAIVLWASVVGYSRIYLGVHYPADVICGSMLGSVIGWGIYKLYQYTDYKFLSHRPYFNHSD